MYRIFTFIICLIGINLCLFSMPKTSHSSTTAIELDSIHDEQEEELLSTIIDARNQTLQRINEDIDQLRKELSALVRDNAMAREIAIIEREFRAIKTMAQISATHPIETSMLRSFLTEMLQNITKITTPFKDDIDILKIDIKELLQLVRGDDFFKITHNTDPQIRIFFERLETTKKYMEQTKETLEELLKPAILLQNNVIEYEKKIAGSMPALWKNYYLVPIGMPFKQKSWHNMTNDISSTFNMRLGTEIPQSRQTWASLFLRMLLACSSFFFLHLLKRYISAKPPTALSTGALRLCTNSLFWFCLALVLCAAIFSSDSLIYYPFIILSIFFLYFTQMSLAGDLYAFIHPQIPRHSILWPLFIPPCTGLFLLLLDLPPVITTISWFITLVIAFIAVYRAKKRESPFYLPRLLLCGYLPFICLAFIMGLLGWTRLAVILCVLYVSVGILLQQSIGLIRLSDYISKILPKQGVRGILWGTLLAFLVPVFLMLFMILAILWLIPYPGSRYFLHDIPTFILNSGSDSLSFLQILFIISIFFIVRSCIQVVHAFFATLHHRSTWFSSNLIKPIQAGATYIFWSLFGLYVLKAFGFNLSNLAVVAGGFSVGIGFGMQHIVSNFFSGLIVIFGEIVREDDIIEIRNEVDSIIGVVKKINVRSTTLETFDNATIFIPNEQLISGHLTNWTRNGRMVRKKICLSVAYGTDIQKVLNLLQQVVDNNYEILKVPEPRIRFRDFNNSRLNFTIGIWVADIAWVSTIEAQISTYIEQLFRENDVSIDC